ncbi:malate/lactate/ureidoglycolate dehydrogenase [Granulosicoccus antarcticus]|uniref:Putative oxidoreductase YbiC n=1 Tax=Granulosicoccus antarcticus IMCC3135 TaxID=1192854 RepID=A0A2Z2NRJ3_9GAMM|nr:malate/lactate/ureidoglycolate dehydrogenase [Granulosicoccus antarcticus]ASJ72631.1 putative oxidoreductase YbiC [Granulosicoccus antarcticus IMCC3135]
MPVASNYTSQSVKQFATAVLKGFGCNENEADIVASHLTDANLTGHDSHGIGMLPLYGEQILDGNLVPNQEPLLHAPMGAISVVDAKRGFGHRMALLALDHAMKCVPEHKVAILALRDSGHVSRVGTYSEYCAARGYVSIHMVNVVGHAPIVAPFGARESGFSTNPISMAMPLKGQAKPLLDIATSTVAFGKVRVASNKGEKVPPGCLIDEQGLETLDPDPMAQSRQGSLSAFGAHKGSGLGIFVELLAGALSSTDTVATMEHLPHGVINNMFSIIIDPSAFDSRKAIEQRTEEFYNFIKSRQPAVGTPAVLLPGETEHQNRQQRTDHGIPVDDETVRQIVDIADRFKLDPTAINALLTKAS